MAGSLLGNGDRVGCRQAEAALIGEDEPVVSYEVSRLTVLMDARAGPPNPI